MPRPHMIVLVGIPGSGKTTYAVRLHARCPLLRIVSPDAIRAQFHPGYNEGRVDVRRIDDRRIFRMAYDEAEAALAHGHSVLFDATSLTLARRKKLIAIARRYDATVSARYFPVSLATAFKRNHLRTRRVPPGAIAHMAHVLIPPQRDEGFDRIVVYRAKRWR